MSMARIPSMSIVTAPATEPISLSEAKLFLKIDHSVDDTLISSMIIAARQSAEDYLKKSLITQTRKIAFNDYSPSEILLPFGPIIAITSITLFTRDAEETVVSSNYYFLSVGHDLLVTDANLLSHKIEIIYTAGYGTAIYVPDAIKQGMLAHIAALYDGRSVSLPVPDTAFALYQPYRLLRI